MGEQEQTPARSELLQELSGRRSYRRFSSRPVALTTVRECVRLAASAPSGANQQPWTYVIVGDSEVKARIRTEAEEVEREFYRRRVTDDWQAAIEPLGVDWRKPFLEEAQFLVCVFAHRYGIEPDGTHIKHYYAGESVAISVGFFILAARLLGLATVPYTPAPMGFLRQVLGRPPNERPIFILPVGYPHDEYVPPDVSRKEPSEYLVEML